MKRVLTLLAAAALCLGLSACQLGPGTPQLSDEEVVLAVVEAFRQGDYEGMKPYIDGDNPLHQFFAKMDPETGGELAPVYQALYENLKDVTVTAEADEEKELWGTVNATLAMPDYSAALHDAMVSAMADEVAGSAGAFHRMPDWMLKAAQGGGQRREDSFVLHVGSRDGEMVMDTNTNREFFAMLCGGIKPYMNASMTTCTFLDGMTWEIAAQGDEIVAMISTEYVQADESYTQEDLEAIAQSFVDAYSAIDGITAWAGVQDGVLTASYGVDMENASTYALNQMGIISDRITAGSQGWLSLDSTISGFTREGAACVTESFQPEQ